MYSLTFDFNPNTDSFNILTGITASQPVCFNRLPPPPFQTKLEQNQKLVFKQGCHKISLPKL